MLLISAASFNFAKVSGIPARAGCIIHLTSSTTGLLPSATGADGSQGRLAILRTDHLEAVCHASASVGILLVLLVRLAAGSGVLTSVQYALTV